MNIKLIERVIDLDEKYKTSLRKMKDQTKADVKDQVYMALLDLTNPDRINLFDCINNSSVNDKDYLFALMKFGRDLEIATKKDLEYYKTNTRITGEQDIDYMIGRSLSKYLKNGLMKLDLIKRNN